MRRSQPFCFLILLSFALITGCAGGGRTLISVGGSPLSGTLPASLAFTATPPTNVNLLSFQVTITGAVLNPGNVSLVNTPTTIDLQRLESGNAIVSTTNIPPGTHNSITISFANASLTFRDDSNVVIAGCAPRQICTIAPPSAANVTFSGPPFPITVTANTPVGLLVQLILGRIISSGFGIDFTAPGSVTVSVVPGGQLTGQLFQGQSLLGVVISTNATNRQFVLRTAQGDLLITTDSSTVFSNFEEAQLGNTFTSVMANQILAVDLAFLGNGTLLATRARFEDLNLNENEAEGVIVSVDSPTQFKMVVLQEAPVLLGLSVGNVVTVTISPGATFSVDAGGLVTSGFSFNSANDLLVGQQVQVRFRALTTGPPLAIVADRIQLKESRFTGTVFTTPTGTNFTVNNLSSLFTLAGIAQINVQTSAQTIFRGSTGINGLATGNIVFLGGLLFRQPSGIPVLVTGSVFRQ